MNPEGISSPCDRFKANHTSASLMRTADITAKRRHENALATVWGKKIWVKGRTQFVSYICTCQPNVPPHMLRHTKGRTEALCNSCHGERSPLSPLSPLLQPVCVCVRARGREHIVRLASE